MNSIFWSGFKSELDKIARVVGIEPMPDAKQIMPSQGRTAPSASAPKADPFAAASKNFQASGGFKSLNEAVTARNSAAKGSNEYNMAQNAINNAYGKGPQRAISMPEVTVNASGAKTPAISTATPVAASATKGPVRLPQVASAGFPVNQGPKLGPQQAPAPSNATMQTPNLAAAKPFAPTFNTAAAESTKPPKVNEASLLPISRTGGGMPKFPLGTARVTGWKNPQ
jgi:hypothetical protein